MGFWFLAQRQKIYEKVWIRHTCKGRVEGGHLYRAMFSYSIWVSILAFYGWNNLETSATNVKTPKFDNVDYDLPNALDFYTLATCS